MTAATSSDAKFEAYKTLCIAFDPEESVAKCDRTIISSEETEPDVFTTEAADAKTAASNLKTNIATAVTEVFSISTIA